ncbi:MAG: H-NS histone family protein [Cycloclasticus sp.]|jgi:DNA-binding protein H-NS|nr:H-NS histone family protein [Cycloclasticus sp.]
MSIDLSKMSMDDLIELEKNVQKAKAALEKKRVIEARKAIENAAREYGLTVDEVLGSSATTGSAPKGAPRYVNPDDPDQTWTGRGRQPAWYKAAIAAGTDPATLEI